MTPLLVSLLLSASAAPPPPPPSIEPVTVTLQQKKRNPPSFVLARGGTRRIDLIRGPKGQVQRLIVSRTDGKPMTECDPYLALLEEHFWCDNQVGECQDYQHIASGFGFGIEAGDACANARTDMCQYAYCPWEEGSYRYCTLLTNRLCTYVGTQGGNCVYGCGGMCDSVAPCQ